MLPVMMVILAAALVAAAPALAVTQRGHVFSFAFGKSGKGEGEFSHPSGVAVNDETGDVYVADKKNGALEQFKPIVEEGELVEEAFIEEAAVASPTAVAIDNSREASDPSRGDVYVVGSSGKTIFKFGPSGELITKITEFKEGGAKSKEKLSGIEGVAVSAQGALVLDGTGDELLTYNDATVNQGESDVATGLEASEARGFALDSEGAAYVGTDATSEDAKKRQKEEQRQAMFGVAKVDPQSATVLIAELDAEDTTGVAVDQSTDEAYISNLISGPGGKPATTLAAFTSGGTLIQRLSAPGLSEGEGVAVDSESHIVYVADAASARVYVFAVDPPGRPTVEGLTTQTLVPGEGISNATKLEAQVNPEGAETHYRFEYGGASCAAEPAACTDTPTAGLAAGFGAQPVSAEIQDLAPGTYYYRVLAENSFGEVASAEQTFTIVASIGGLPDARGWELVSPPDKAGAEPEAPTKEGGTIQASESGAAISYVADGPIPAGSQAEGVRSPEFTQVLSTRGPQGGWSSQNLTTPNTSGFGILVGVSPEYQTFSSTLALGLVKPNFGNENSGSLERPPLAPEALERTAYLRDDAPLAPAASEEADYNAAISEGEKMEPHNAGFLPLVSALNAPGGKPFGGGNGEGLVFETATPDLGHVVLATYKGEPGLYEWNGAGETELERVSVLPASEGGEFLSPVVARVGAESKNVRHAISDDGSRVFWSTVGGHLYVTDPQTKETLRVDTNAGGSGAGEEHAAFQTASADGSRVFFTDNQALTPQSRPGGEGNPDLYMFELKPGTPLSGTLRDLTPEGLEGASANVVATGNGAGVIAASEDGSYIYFVADGVLAPGAKRGTCPREPKAEPHGVTCNLYVRHFNGKDWEPTSLIAPLSSEDYPDWEGAGTDDLDGMTAGASPEGHYLAFMSDLPLTGYDNEDVSSEAPGERLDEEVYLYDAETGRLVCASCDSTGARPQGVFDFGAHGEGAGEGLGLVVDRPQTWAEGDDADHWLAGSLPGWTSESAARAIYQPRYISDNGRLFFNSADALVSLSKPTKTELVNGEKQQVGVENVYEYERQGLGDCASSGGCVSLISSGTSEHESAFLDASVGGNDVFFLTAAQLSTTDHDGLFDVYDAHVCEASSPCAPPPPPPPAPPCEGEACQGTYTPPAPFSTPPSATFNGSGNLTEKIQVLSEKEAKKTVAKHPLTRAQKLAKALRTCRAKFKKHKSKRLACEKQARQKYGPKHKKTTNKTSGKGK